MKKLRWTLLLLTAVSWTAFASGGTTCGAPAVIGVIPFSDSGNFDADDDCNSPLAEPYNDVFYSFTPPATAVYQFLLRGYGRQPSLRILRDGCCADGTGIGASSSTVATDCGETANSTVYYQIHLVAGTTYYFHLGTVSTQVSAAAYDFEVTSVPCPRNESATTHNTCQLAESISPTDSLLGDNSNSSNPDWYRFVLTEAKSVRIFCGGREFGHCISGIYPFNPGQSAVDGRFQVYTGSNCNNLTRLASADDEGCSSDAIANLGCLAPGNYYVRVNCYGSQTYLLKVEANDPPACPTVELPGQHCSGPCIGPIPDVTTVSYAIPIDVQYHITDLNVRLTLTHTRDSNLEIWLVTPWADSILLSNKRGGSGDNFIETVFDDEAAMPIGSGVAPFTGSYRPDELLSAVDENFAGGTWLIVVRDGVTTEFGYLNCVCLEFSYDRILDVELASFDAEPLESAVKLRWSTASESGNSAFEIERDGQLVHRADGAGTAATGRNYEWIDSGLGNESTHEYKLFAIAVNSNRTELARLSATPALSGATVSSFALHQNYPNPFNPETSIAFDLPESGPARLVVFNLIGQEVAVVVDKHFESGRHIVSFSGHDIPAGIYVYRLETGNFSNQKKMILLK